VVKDYAALVSLLGRLGQAEQDDAETDGIRYTLLVVQAHMSRAAYNFWRSASRREKQKWDEERCLRRKELVHLIEKEIKHLNESRPLDPRDPVERRQAFHLRECVEVAGEECAKPRALDEISAAMQEELLSLPDVVE